MGILHRFAGWQFLVVSRICKCVSLSLGPVAENLEKLLCGQTEEFCDWLRDQLPRDRHPFEKTSVDADLEVLTDAVSVLRAPSPPLGERDGVRGFCFVLGNDLW